jgi:hypothetical protein
MSSNIDKFIQENRNSFDEDRPSQGVWNEIETTLPVKKTKQFTLRDLYKFSAAAAVTCILLTSVYFLYLRKQESATTIQTPPEQKAELKNVSPEYELQMIHAFSAIQTRQLELKNATADNPELYQQFIQDLQVLDSTYRMLQKQAAQTANRDVIMKAMIQNLQLQAELLYRQLLITTELKQNRQQPTDAELKG